VRRIVVGTIGALVLGMALWLASRISMAGPMPSFEVARSECEGRAPRGRSGPSRIVVWQSRASAGQGATIESNGRWERRYAFNNEQFTPPDDVTRGCLAPDAFDPLFEELTMLLASDAGGAPPLDASPPITLENGDWLYPPCVASYVIDDADAGARMGRCELSELASRILAAVPASTTAAAPREPEPCAMARCSLAIRVGHVPHPHEGSSVRSVELFRDGTVRCEREGAPFAARLTNGSALFDWLVTGASAPPPIEPTETFDPIRLALVRDGRGEAREGLDFDVALVRWNAIAARIDSACVVEPE
jgi:hypothetical protein